LQRLRDSFFQVPARVTFIFPDCGSGISVSSTIRDGGS